MKLSEILDLDIIDINNARLLGKVNGVFIYKSTYKIGFLACLKDDIQLAIPLDATKLTPQSVIANNSLIADAHFLVNNLFFTTALPCYDKLGVKLGNSIDVTISSKSKTFSTGNLDFPLKKIITCYEIVVVDVESYRLGVNTRAVQKDKGIVEEVSKAYSNGLTDVTTLPNSSFLELAEESIDDNDNFKIGQLTNMLQTSIIMDSDNIAKDSCQIVFVTPKPLNSLTMDYSHLLGKTLYRDICDITRQVVFSKGTLINSETVSAAIRYGKLAELSLYSNRQNY